MTQPNLLNDYEKLQKLVFIAFYFGHNNNASRKTMSSTIGELLEFVNDGWPYEPLTVFDVSEVQNFIKRFQQVRKEVFGK